MTEREKNALRKQAKKLYMEAKDNQAIMLCENGVGTECCYPLALSYEFDAKTPLEWVNSIILHHILNNKKEKLSFKLVEYDEMLKLC